MKAIVGLGNPGREYENTRHNAGWWVVDHLARSWHFDAWRRDGENLSTSGLVGTQRVKLMKPQTFMNLSGQALRPMLKREGFAPANDLLIIADEVAIPLGEFRFRASGGTAGHNGLKSVEAHVKSQQYGRLRVGIKPPEDAREFGDLADYVLRNMPADERAAVEALFPRMLAAVELWAAEGVTKAVSTYGR